MVKLYTDHYFHIGSTHLTSGKSCQDYAISDVYNDAALAIVSDGCSTGGYTDVGARILALSTATAIREHWTINRKAFGETIPLEVSLRQKIALAGTRQVLDLQPHDMLATCAYAYVSPEGGFVHVQGDGVVAMKYQDGRITMSRFEWGNNTPYYPAYSEEGLANFIREHGDNLSALRLSEERWVQEVSEEFFELDKKQYTLSEGIQGVTIDIPEDLLGELVFIAIFSDGVTRIDNLDWKNSVTEFMAFKNTTGEFAKRRMIRGIKDTQKIGKGPVDDISYAVVRVERIGRKED